MRTVALKENYSTNGSLSESMLLDDGKTYELVSVSLAINAAPTTSESFTITLNAAAGPAYDVLLYTKDLSIESVEDLFWEPPARVLLQGGDAIDVAYANTDAGLLGVEITAERRAP